MVAMAPDGADSWWHVDLAARKTVTGTGTCDTPATWNVSAPASAWEDVIRHGVNLGTAFRRLGMRYRDRGDAGEGSAISDLRVAMMSDLLSINSWRPGTAEEPAT